MQKPKHQSIWRDMTSSPSFSSLAGTVKVDTAVVGAGITGITAALRLALAGRKVAVIDMGSVSSGETGKTTGHLTMLADGGVATLRKKHGDAAAAGMLAAQAAAIDEIEAHCGRSKEPTRFRRVPGWMYSENKEGVARVEEEAAALRALGFAAEQGSRVPLPFSTQSALRVENQAQFEAVAYLAALTARLVEAGGLIFTQSPVIEVQDGTPCRAVTAHGELHADQLILATHTPPNRLAYHPQIFAYRTYALAATSHTLPPPGLYFDTEDPYHYSRTQDTPDGEVLIVGGQDHKTGKQTEGDCFAELTSWARDRFPIKAVANIWSGQIMEPADLLPFVGPNGADKNILFASGYSGNGLTLGTVAAGILADTVLGRTHPYAHLFSSRRLDIAAQLRNVAKENVDIPIHMVGDRAAALVASDENMQPEEGRVLVRGAQSVAVYCDKHGKQHQLSAVCPHLGCIVNWNTEEKSWDCPCHGSRFSATGTLLNGPALSNLSALES